MLTCLLLGTSAAVPAQPERGPRIQPDTRMGMYAPGRHELYDGRFRIKGSRIFPVGTLQDPSPGDHMGDDAANLRTVHGEALIDVDEIANSRVTWQ